MFIGIQSLWNLISNNSTKAIMAKIKACYLPTELIVSKVSFWLTYS